MARINGVSESPCSTSVARITEKLIKMISARKGKGCPAAVVIGNANAAANVTIPRIPVQPIRKREDQDGIGSRTRNEGISSRGSIAAKGTHPKRTTMAVPLTSAPAISSSLN